MMEFGARRGPGIDGSHGSRGMNRGAGDWGLILDRGQHRQREILNARRSLHVVIDHELELVSRDCNAYALVPLPSDA